MTEPEVPYLRLVGRDGIIVIRKDQIVGYEVLDPSRTTEYAGYFLMFCLNGRNEFIRISEIGKVEHLFGVTI